MLTATPFLTLAGLVRGQSTAGIGGSEGPDLTRYLLVCAGLILLVGALAWLAKRLLAGQMQRRAARRSLQVLDVLPLGGKLRLAVVRCYDRTFLLGLGDKEVGLVSELDAVIAPPGGGGATSVESRSFAELLRRAKPRPSNRREPVRAGLDPEGVLG
jgi:flagellar biogenesis protein FliO